MGAIGSRSIPAKRVDEERQTELRAIYGIPPCFSDAWELEDGRISFDFCDQSIIIYPDGRAELHYLAMPNEYSYPQPATRPWGPMKNGI